MRKKTYVMAMMVLVTICLLSGYFYFSIKRDLDASHITLKNGMFALTKKTYALDFVGPADRLYDVILEVSGAASDLLKDVDSGKLALEIQGELRNSNNVVIRSFLANEWKNVRGGSTMNSFRLDLATFSFVPGEKYSLKLSFESNDIRFDETVKEIYLEQQRDYAAVPFLALLQLVGLIAFFITIILMLVLSVVFFLRRRRRN